MKQTYDVVEFDITDMLPIGMTMVVAGIGIAYGLEILGDMRDDVVSNVALSKTCNTTLNGGTGAVYTGCGAQYNATADSISATAKIPEKLPMIATVVVAAIIIGVLVRYLMVRFA